MVVRIGKGGRLGGHERCWVVLGWQRRKATRKAAAALVDKGWPGPRRKDTRRDIRQGRGRVWREGAAPLSIGPQALWANAVFGDGACQLRG